jgi:hypothetical protein
VPYIVMQICCWSHYVHVCISICTQIHIQSFQQRLSNIWQFEGSNASRFIQFIRDSFVNWFSIIHTYIHVHTTNNFKTSKLVFICTIYQTCSCLQVKQKIKNWFQWAIHVHSIPIPIRDCDRIHILIALTQILFQIHYPIFIFLYIFIYTYVYFYTYHILHTQSIAIICIQNWYYIT